MNKHFILLVVFLGCLRLNAQENSLPTFITDSLNAYIEDGIKEWKIPGVSVAIVKGDSLLYLKGFGVTDLESNAPVDENTLFMIGSNTKTFTATALSILDESTEFKLTDKVQKWMPEFYLKDSLANMAVNIVDLLSHRIGFENFQGDFAHWTSTVSRAGVIQKMSLMEAPYGFRTKWGYCNAAFVAAGELVPRIINRSWEETVKDSILTPLKMNRTLMLTAEMKNASNSAKPHSFIGDSLIQVPFAKLNNLAPAGSMSSSAKDMSQWVIAHLNNGKIKEEQVISAEALQKIRNSSAIVAVDSRNNQKTHFYHYGLGLLINDRNGKMVYSHTGGINGFLSSVAFIPEEQLGIIVLTNTDHNNFFLDLTNEIIDAFSNLPFQNHSKQSLQQFKKGRLLEVKRLDSLKNMTLQKNRPSLILKNYTGDYNNDLYGNISLKLEKNKLNIYFPNRPDLVGRLEHLKNDVFLCTYSIPIFGITEIPFKIDNGKVSGVTLEVSDFIEYKPYEFKKLN